VALQAVAEAVALRKQNEKLEYRATHLVRSLRAADAQHGAPTAPPSKPFAARQLPA
jgi:hypothetical protein